MLNFLKLFAVFAAHFLKFVLKILLLLFVLRGQLLNLLLVHLLHLLDLVLVDGFLHGEFKLELHSHRVVSLDKFTLSLVESKNLRCL